jgi:hypothetical protein
MGDEGLHSLDVSMSPLARYHQIDLPSAAFGADEPLAPIRDCPLGAVATGAPGSCRPLARDRDQRPSSLSLTSLTVGA